MSKTSRTADCLIFAARSEKRISWRWADVAARSIASIAPAGRNSAAASSVSWVTIPRIQARVVTGKTFVHKIWPRRPRRALTQDAPGSEGCRGRPEGLLLLGRFGAARVRKGIENALDLLDNLGVVLRVDLGEADHRAGNGELDVLEDAGAGDADGLAGLILGPDAAVLAEGGAHDGGGLAAQGAGAEGAGEPVDGVLQRRGDGAVVFRGDQKQGVSLVGG